MKRILAITLAAALLPALTYADSGDIQPPALHCHKPMPPPKKNPTKAQVDSYNKALPKYRSCIQAYVSARSSDAQKYSKLSEANAKAANAAIEQFNALVKEVGGK